MWGQPGRSIPNSKPMPNVSRLTLAAHQLPFRQGRRARNWLAALHIDMKLWKPKRPLGRPYRINDAFATAWLAARLQTIDDRFRDAPADRKNHH